MGRSTKRPKRAAATWSDSNESTGQLAEGHGKQAAPPRCLRGRNFSGGVDHFPGASWKEDFCCRADAASLKIVTCGLDGHGRTKFRHRVLILIN